jgi:hypothetical protein
VFGAIIIFASVVIARLIARTIERGDQGTRIAAPVVRVAIIILGTAIGLRFMGLADDIINLAFGLLLGAIAVAFALAFGLGGRDAAGQAVKRMIDRTDRPANNPMSDPVGERRPADDTGIAPASPNPFS